MEAKNELVTVMAESHLMTRENFWHNLRSTVVPEGFSNEETMVFLAVAHNLGLNPLANEIYAFKKGGKIMPMVGVDGWLRRANENPAFDGMDVTDNEEDHSCTCTIWRKDRSHPVKITEYLAECRLDTGPWTSHPRRMLRHRAIIQAIRIAFGSGGAYDENDKIYMDTQYQEVDPTPVTETGTSELVEKLKQKVGESEQDQTPKADFTTVKGVTCSEDGCKRRLIRQCQQCSNYFCSTHFDLNTESCINCISKQDETDGDEKPEPHKTINERLLEPTTPKPKSLAELRAEKAGQEQDEPF